MVKLIKTNKYYLIIALILAFAAIRFIGGITVSLNMKSDAIKRGIVKIYTQKRSADAFSENSVYAKEVTLSDKYSAVDFKLKQYRVNNLRLDLEGYDSVYIKNIKIKVGPFTLKNIEYEELYSRTISVNGAVHDILNGRYEIFLEESYMNAIFATANRKLDVIVFLYYIVLFFFTTIFICMIMLGVQRIDLLLGNKRTIVYKGCLLIITLVGLLLVDLKTFDYISGKKEESYVRESMQTIEAADDRVLSGCVTARSSKIVKLNILVMDDINKNVLKNIKVTVGNSDKTKDITLSQKDGKTFLAVNTRGYRFIKGESYKVDVVINTDYKNPFLLNQDKSLRIVQVYSFKAAGWLIGVVALINIIVLGLEVFLIIKEQLTNRIIAIFALLIGIVASIIVTPLRIDDEYRHFLRAYSYATGHFKIQHTFGRPEGLTGVAYPNSQGDYSSIKVPSTVDGIKYIDEYTNNGDGAYFAEINNKTCYTELVEQLCEKNSGDKKTVSTVGVEVISPLAYLPQIIAVFIGRLFRFNGLILFYLARIGNVIAGVGILYLASRLAPEYNMPIWLCGFVPNTLILRSSCNTDAISIPLVILLIAYILHLRYESEKINIKRLLFILGVCCWIACIKLPFIIPVGLMLILGDNNYVLYKGVKRFGVSVGLACIIFVLSCVFYYGNSKIIEPIPSKTSVELMKRIEAGDKTAVIKDKLVGNESKNIKFLIEHPLDVAKFMLKEFKSLPSRASIWLTNYSKLGKWYSYCLLLPLLLKRRNKYVERLWLCGISGLMWLAVLLVFYLLAGIEVFPLPGIGARYILPVIPPLIFALPQGNEKTERVINMIWPFLLLALSGINVIWLFDVFI